MRDHVKTTYDYRGRQTRLHRRKMQGRRVFIKKYYLVFLTILVVSNFIYTFLKPVQAGQPVIPVERKAVTQPKVKSSTSLVSMTIPSMRFFEARQVFAAELKPNLIPLPTSTDNWENFKNEARSIAKIYGYPANLIIAQAALESAHGTSSFAINRNNYFGIGAYDFAPNEAFVYDNPAQSIIDYIYVVKNNFPEAWNNRQDAYTMLTLLENNARGSQYATDPDYVTKVSSEPEWSE